MSLTLMAAYQLLLGLLTPLEFLYPGERVDFSLSWPESAFKTDTQITIEIDKE